MLMNIWHRLERGKTVLTEKELKKLNRYQLLEMLIIQTERADQLQRKLEEAENLMNNQDIQLSVLGSIAEASLQLSGVFEAAQSAADRYLAEARRHAAEIEEEARLKAAYMIADAEKKSRNLLKKDKII